MANNYLITGYWGTPHVTAENDRGIHAAIFGAGRFVLPVGERFRAEYIGNNTIRMYDGKLLDNGAAAGIPAGEYVDLTIVNSSQGMKRNDLIIFQYRQDASTLIETGIFTVLQGTETSGTPSDPQLVQSDLLSGSAASDQVALWRVPVTGATIGAPVQMFVTAENIVNHKHTKSEISDFPSSMPASDVKAWAKASTKPAYTASEVGAAPTTHTHTVSQITDLPEWVKQPEPPSTDVDTSGLVQKSGDTMTGALSFSTAEVGKQTLKNLGIEIQRGVRDNVNTSGVQVTFAEEFSGIPTVIATGGSEVTSVRARDITTTGFRLVSGQDNNDAVQWVAIYTAW